MIGLWVYKGTVLRALFGAHRIPTHERELILHRYEGTNHQGQAKYRYFVVHGYAGMILTHKGFEAANIQINHMWASLSETHNKQEGHNWIAKYSTINPEDDSKPFIVSIEDTLNNLSPIILSIT